MPALSVVTHWVLFRDFIGAYREKYKRENPGVEGMAADTIYQDFQALATEWTKHPLKQIRRKRSSLKKGTADSGSPTTPPSGAQAQTPVQQQLAPQPEALAPLSPSVEKQQPSSATGA